MNANEMRSYSGVGVKLIERDHDNLSEILSEIQFRITSGLASGKTSELVRKLAHHMQLHFALEEGMMTASRYPGIDLHRLQHQLLVDQVHILAKERGRGALERNAALLNFFAATHIKHMGHADLHYGIWLNAGSPRHKDTACAAEIDLCEVSALER
jgi:hemerythrin